MAIEISSCKLNKFSQIVPGKMYKNQENMHFDIIWGEWVNMFKLCHGQQGCPQDAGVILSIAVRPKFSVFNINMFTGRRNIMVTLDY